MQATARMLLFLLLLLILIAAIAAFLNLMLTLATMNQ